MTPNARRKLPVHLPRIARGPLLLAVLIATALGTFGLASASAHGGFGRGVIPAAAGVVSTAPSGSSADNSFVITLRGGGTETVDVSSATTYLERGAPGASITSVGSGDLVAVFGTTSGTTVTASEVVIAVPRGSGGGQIPAAAGIVQTAPVGTSADNTFTIKTRGGTLETVDVSGSTSYDERGVSSPSVTNVVAGDLVAAFGTTSGTTVTASLVVIHTRFRHGFAAAGTVQTAPVGTNADNTFTIKTPGGAVETVDVSTSTTYSERGVTGPSIVDVASGDRVGVFGTVSGSTVTASAVWIAAPPPTPGTFATAGTVQSTPVGDSFVIETCSHTQVTVDVTGTTTYEERGVADASLTDVKTTDDVAVFGTTSGSTVTATEVVIGGNDRGSPGHFFGGPPVGGPPNGGHRRGGVRFGKHR
jgi:hypothetical protein